MLFASLRVSFLLQHFELEIQFLEIENLRFTFYLREGILLDAVPLFANLRVSFLLKHFELEIQFLEIENLCFTFHFARRSVASCFLQV